MSDENIFEELLETRRKLWAESDGTLDGYFRHCCDVGSQARERFLAELERVQAEGKWGTDAVPEYAGAVCVHEGEPSNYPTTKLPNGNSDFAHSGAEGE